MMKIRKVLFLLGFSVCYNLLNSFNNINLHRVECNEIVSDCANNSAITNIYYRLADEDLKRPNGNYFSDLNMQLVDNDDEQTNKKYLKKLIINNFPSDDFELSDMEIWFEDSGKHGGTGFKIDEIQTDSDKGERCVINKKVDSGKGHYEILMNIPFSFRCVDVQNGFPIYSGNKIWARFYTRKKVNENVEKKSDEQNSNFCFDIHFSNENLKKPFELTSYDKIKIEKIVNEKGEPFLKISGLNYFSQFLKINLEEVAKMCVFGPYDEEKKTQTIIKDEEYIVNLSYDENRVIDRQPNMDCFLISLPNYDIQENRKLRLEFSFVDKNNFIINVMAFV